MKTYVTAALAAAWMVVSASRALSGGSVVELSAFRAVSPDRGDGRFGPQPKMILTLPQGPSESDPHEFNNEIEPSADLQSSVGNWIGSAHSSGARASTFELPASASSPFVDEGPNAPMSHTPSGNTSAQQTVEAQDGVSVASPDTPATGVPLPPALWGALGIIGGIAATLRLRRRA